MVGVKKASKESTPIQIKICRYGRIEEWESRQDAIKFYRQHTLNSKGVEKERYETIYEQLMDGDAAPWDMRESITGDSIVIPKGADAEKILKKAPKKPSEPSKVRAPKSYKPQPIPTDPGFNPGRLVIRIADDPEKNSNAITIDSKIQDGFKTCYPGDSFYSKIAPDATFRDVDYALHTGKSIYDAIGVHDSIAREQVFLILAGIKGVRYEDVYSLWLNGPPKKTPTKRTQSKPKAKRKVPTKKTTVKKTTTKKPPVKKKTTAKRK